MRSAWRYARDALLYPRVIKPVDGGGGLGIWLVEEPSQLDAAVTKLVETMNYGGRGFSGFIVESRLAMNTRCRAW